MPKKFTLILLSDNNQTPVQFNISQQFFKRIIIGSSVIGVILVFLIIFGIFQFFQSFELDHLRKKSSVFYQEIEQLQTKIKTFETAITKLVKNEKQLRTFAGLPELSEDIRMAGFGGTNQITNHELEVLDLDTRENLVQLTSRIEFMLRESRVEIESFNEIEKKLSALKVEINYTPYIKPTRGWYSSYFGKRRSPFTSAIEFHPGLDIVAPKGAPVLSSADGIVTYAGWKNGYGNVIEINHNNRFMTLYGHLHKIDVQIGQTLKRYDLIGYVGSTGRSTNNHLHYEIRMKINGNFEQINPLPYILD